MKNILFGLLIAFAVAATPAAAQNDDLIPAMPGPFAR